MRASILCLLSGLVLSATAATAAATPSRAERAALAMDKAIEGRTQGEPVTCISLPGVASTEIIEQTAILYRMHGGKLYVNVPRAGRASLDRDDILVSRTVGARLCSLDTLRLFERGANVEIGSVNLGAFVPYDAPRR